MTTLVSRHGMFNTSSCRCFSLTWRIGGRRSKKMLGLFDSSRMCCRLLHLTNYVESVDRTATRNAIKNARRLHDHVSHALYEWRLEHPNNDVLDPEYELLGELLTGAEQRLMAAQEDVKLFFESSGSKYSDIEESCTKFLDAIASKFAELYDFPREFEDFAIVEDVFRAIESDSWTPKSADQVSLPEFYSDEEWQALRTLLEDTTDLRNKNRKPFQNSRGEIVVVLPHDGFENYCHVMKKVAQICASWGDDGDWDPNALVLIDEQDLGFASTSLNDQQQ
ncbi:hypothetical protein AC1031_006687 [Aphanomyces cochlioides]|nr:hypothetical protein AC1031_006687 [Aphanomyces cochlioides]